MRCEICGSHVLQHCPTPGCGIGLCPESYGPECVRVHDQKHHPEKTLQPTMGGILGKVKEIKDQKAAADRQVVHFRDENKNLRARFSDLAKWLKATNSHLFGTAKTAGFIKDSDLQE